MGAVVGTTIPFHRNMPSGLIPAALVETTDGFMLKGKDGLTVLQQRLYRDVWDETLQWMIAEQGMPEPKPEEYARMLNYLGTYPSPDSVN